MNHGLAPKAINWVLIIVDKCCTARLYQLPERDSLLPIRRAEELRGWLIACLLVFWEGD